MKLSENSQDEQLVFYHGFFTIEMDLKCYFLLSFSAVFLLILLLFFEKWPNFSIRHHNYCKNNEHVYKQ